ncbi:MAG: penicillin-insensitive murein endopeptidase [Deltaproteobacteria bacterium]|nr:penicillin-insensitive murein endopeptidase [Deltaproteobacteria bacterium]
MRGPRPLLPACLGGLLALQGCAAFFTERGVWDEGSRGSPSNGWLSRGYAAPVRGHGFIALRSEREGWNRWGTERLVRMVEKCARRVGTNAVPLVVGDLSARRGGMVTRHHSHRNGRDVDLLFFARDAATDEPVRAPAFVRYNSRGESVAHPTALRFDTARNWRLVEALLADADAGIIRIFVASWIKGPLLAYARAHGAREEVLERAEALLVQPGDSAPHDDHFHVRLACTPGERARGCVDGGPLWHWLEKDFEKGDAAPADDETILAALEELPPGVLHGPPEEPRPDAAQGPVSREQPAEEPEVPAGTALVCLGAAVASR